MAPTGASADARPKLRLAEPKFGSEALEAVGGVLASGHLTLGPRVAEFERSVASELGVRHAIAVSSGTTALHVALAAIGIGAGDEVIVPDFTHPATGHAVLHQGARPVLVDVDPVTYNVQPAAVEASLSPRTRLVIAVDLFGLPADYPSLRRLLEPRSIPLLCDAACSLGAEMDGGSPTRYGVAATFSFHPRKILTTGEGGMVTTDNDALARRIVQLRNHGFDSSRFREPGFNYRMSDILAAIGSAQVPHLAQIVRRRNELARQLSARLETLDLIRTPVTPAGVRPTFQAYVAVLDERVDREQFIAALAERGVESTIGTYALHAQPSFQAACGTEPGDIPVSSMLAQRTVALPLHPGLSDDDIEVIAEAVREALSESA